MNYGVLIRCLRLWHRVSASAPSLRRWRCPRCLQSGQVFIDLVILRNGLCAAPGDGLLHSVLQRCGRRSRGVFIYSPVWFFLCFDPNTKQKPADNHSERRELGERFTLKNLNIFSSFFHVDSYFCEPLGFSYRLRRCPPFSPP